MSPRPDLEVIVPRASEEEAAAIVAAVQQFSRDTAPLAAPATIEPALSAWKLAGLLDGISRQPDQ
jgi:hypothetical protein